MRLGYEGAGVREIASGAGVTAMLVNRYFGSKENLFAEVVAETMATSAVVLPKILTPPVSGDVIAAALVEITKAGATPLDGFQMMMRSASSERAAEIGREQIEKHHHADITASLGGPHASERAALMLSLIAGFQMMRQMVGLNSLTVADPKVLVELLGPVFNQLVHGDKPSLKKSSKTTAKQ